MDSVLPVPFMNFTQFWKIYNDSKDVIDPTDKYESSIEIHIFFGFVVHASVRNEF